MTGDKDTAKEISESLGSETITSVSRNGKKLSINKDITESVDEKPLLTYDELMRLKMGETVVLRVMYREAKGSKKGEHIMATPIINMGEHRMKYAYEYLSDIIPRDQILYKSKELDRILAANEDLRDMEFKLAQVDLEKTDHIDDVAWHMIGRLQSNKVKYILGKVCLIHSLSSISTAKEIQRLAEKKDIYVNCLIQMNIAREEQKSGVLEEEIGLFREEVAKLDRIRIRGLMTMAPLTMEADEARPVFAGLKKWFDRFSADQTDNFKMEYLSMGMSGDYTQAIEEGANIVRIGSAIFR